ncbi:hypothetical protein C8R43DRAFT_935011 [Mycena crocata]|nr:hypothetical protein C8R43DRAFT_935011 [Mycena crocata]
MSAETVLENHTATRYIIPAKLSEKERLAKQYAAKKSIYGWSTAIPDTIDVTNINNVLDIAAGTCIWTLDFACMPQICARRDKVRLYACDINPGFFPDPSITGELGITTFTQDVTLPFPAEYSGMFDLIHVSLLFLCLTEDGWSSAIANFRTLLQPGGVILLEEADPILLRDQDPLGCTPEDADEDFRKHMEGSTWLEKANCLYTGFALKKGFIVGLTFKLHSMLQKAGLAIQHREHSLAPFGKCCTIRKGLKGNSLAEYAAISVDNMTFILAHTAGSLLKDGTLEVPPGNVATSEGIQAILEEIKVGLHEEGALVRGAYFIVTRIEK